MIQIGRPAPEPCEIETLDEVLVMVRRRQILDQPFSEDALLAWHAYAVEYSLRVRREGLRAAAIDIPLTHNSLTTNLARLDEAHRRVGELFPEMLPIVTTCGVVHRRNGPRAVLRTLRRATGGAIWFKESLAARSAAKHAPNAEVVLGDIRTLVDAAAALCGMESIRALDVQQVGVDPTHADGLSRFGRAFSAATVTLGAAGRAIVERADTELLLVTNLTPAGLATLRGLTETPHVVGYTRDIGLWVLVGGTAQTLGQLWPKARNHPVPLLGKPVGLAFPVGRHRALPSGPADG